MKRTVQVPEEVDLTVPCKKLGSVEGIANTTLDQQI